MESNFWGIVAWLIIPPAASLMFAGRLKGRSVLGALPYPWFLPKLLYWCLVLSIVNGVLSLWLAAAAWSSDGGGAGLSLVSALNLMTLVLTVPSMVAAYVAWWGLPLLIWWRFVRPLRGQQVASEG